MAKKKTNMGLIIKVVILLLGVLALCMAFLNCVKFIVAKSTSIEGETVYTGFQSMFGYSEKTVLGAEIKVLSFSFMSTLAFVLPLVGAIMSILNNKIVRLVGAVLMIAGAVLIFLVPSLTVLATVDGKLTITSAILDNCTRGLGIGSILGGIFAALGGLVAGYSILKK